MYPGAVLLMPEGAAMLTRFWGIRLLVMESARKNGGNVDEVTIAALDLLDACAAEYQRPRLIERPHGRSGRPLVDPEQKMIKTDAAAQMLNRSTRHVRRLWEQRHLAGERSGNRLFIVESSVIEYLAAKQAS